MPFCDIHKISQTTPAKSLQCFLLATAASTIAHTEAVQATGNLYSWLEISEKLAVRSIRVPSWMASARVYRLITSQSAKMLSMIVFLLVLFVIEWLPLCRDEQLLAEAGRCHRSETENPRNRTS